MADLEFHVAAVTRAVADQYGAAGARGPGALSVCDLAHLGALRARASLGARRVWVLLPTTGRYYTDCITMPSCAADRALPVPDTQSVISEMLHCARHLRSWHELAAAGEESWSMLTTALTEVHPLAPVPVWSGDAVVLAGRWSRQQVRLAVELVALAAFVGHRPPAVVVPLATSLAGGRIPRGHLNLVRYTAEALAEVAGRLDVHVMATTDFARVAPADRRLLDQAGAAFDAAPATGPGIGTGSLSDGQWEVLRRVLPTETVWPFAAAGADLRRSMACALWGMRASQRPWKDLPPDLGEETSAQRQWTRWAAEGVLDRLHSLLVPFPADGSVLPARPPLDQLPTVEPLLAAPSAPGRTLVA